MKFDLDIEFFEIFYLKTDPDQHARQLIAVEVSPGHKDGYRLVFQLQYGSSASWHFWQEMTREPDQLKKMM